MLPQPVSTAAQPRCNPFEPLAAPGTKNSFVGSMGVVRWGQSCPDTYVLWPGLELEEFRPNVPAKPHTRIATRRE